MVRVTEGGRARESVMKEMMEGDRGRETLEPQEETAGFFLFFPSSVDTVVTG